MIIIKFEFMPKMFSWRLLPISSHFADCNKFDNLYMNCLYTRQWGDNSLLICVCTWFVFVHDLLCICCAGWVVIQCHTLSKKQRSYLKYSMIEAKGG